MATGLSPGNAKNVGRAKTLLQALQIIKTEPGATGLLIITTGPITGKLFFEKGFIRNARMSGGLEGEAALEKLVGLRKTRFKYASAKETAADEKSLDLSISDFITQITPVEFAKVSDKRVPARALLTISFLGALTLCIYIIPTAIKDSVTDPKAELHARERLTKLIHADQERDKSQESAELAPTKTSKVKAIAEGKGALPEELRFARSLVEKGKIEAAIPYYEAILKLEPDQIPVRLELINAYIATKKTHSARVLCIKTFKKQLTSSEIGEVWQLFGQCQTD